MNDTIDMSISEVTKCVDKAWMMHYPIKKDRNPLAFLPEYTEKDKVYYFKEPYKTNYLFFSHLLDGIFAYRELPIVNTENESDKLIEVLFFWLDSEDGPDQSIENYSNEVRRLKQNDPTIRSCVMKVM